MDIKEFLLARIAEDEELARAASEPSPHWDTGTDKAGDSDITYYIVEPVNPYVQDACIAELESTGRVGRAHAGHIARHDPARVLRECAAKRVIVEACRSEPEERPTDVELHARAAHPAYEYETTEGPRKQWDNPEEPPEGEGWEPNTAKGYRGGWARLEYTEESYWRRLKPEGERREWKPYIPRELRAPAAVYADHPDYRQEWKP